MIRPFPLLTAGTRSNSSRAAYCLSASALAVSGKLIAPTSGPTSIWLKGTEATCATCGARCQRTFCVSQVPRLHIHNKSTLHRSCKSAPTFILSTNCHYPPTQADDMARLGGLNPVFALFFRMRARSHRVFAVSVAHVRNTDSRKPNPIYQPRPQDQEQGWAKQGATAELNMRTFGSGGVLGCCLHSER